MEAVVRIGVNVGEFPLDQERLRRTGGFAWRQDQRASARPQTFAQNAKVRRPEFFADGRWVPVDISEASKNPQLADYYFGHNPANRFELTKGRDLIVNPAPATGPINFLVYPLLELDGNAVKTEISFSFRRTHA